MKKFLKENWILVVSAIYLLSPIDFIPEMLTGPLGLIDDGGLLLVLIAKALWGYYRSTIKNNKLQITKDNVDPV